MKVYPPTSTQRKQVCVRAPETSLTYTLTRLRCVLVCRQTFIGRLPYVGGSACMCALIAFGWVRAGDLRGLHKLPNTPFTKVERPITTPVNA